MRTLRGLCSWQWRFFESLEQFSATVSTLEREIEGDEYIRTVLNNIFWNFLELFGTFWNFFGTFLELFWNFFEFNRSINRGSFFLIRSTDTSGVALTAVVVMELWEVPAGVVNPVQNSVFQSVLIHVT